MPSPALTPRPVPQKLHDLAAEFGPTLQQVVQAAVARGVDPDEMHEFVSHFRPLLEARPGGPAAGPPAAEPPASFDTPAGLPPLSSLTPVPITAPTFTEFTFWQKGVLHAMLENPATKLLLYAMNRAAAFSPVLQATIGIGASGGGGVGVGLSAGAGIVLSYDGTIGYYGSISGMIGGLAGASAGVCFTIVRGGIDSFTGVTLAATVAGGEEVVGSFSVLFHSDMSFEGVSLFAGLGAGSPFEFYVQASYTWASKGVQANDVLGIGTDHNLWVLASTGATNWVSPPNHTNDNLVGVALALNGTLLGVGTDGNVYSAGSIDTAFTPAPVASPNVPVSSIAVLKTGSLLGVGQSDGLLYVRGSLDSSTPWRKVEQNNTMAVRAAVCQPTGQIVAVGTGDGMMYSRASIDAAWVKSNTSGAEYVSLAPFPNSPTSSLIGVTTAGVLMQLSSLGSPWQSMGDAGSNQAMRAIGVVVHFTS